MPWAEDRVLLDQLYDFLDSQFTSEYLMLDEIAAMILDHVQTHIIDIENSLLEVTYQHLKKSKKLGQLRDAMNFLNYNRDYSCTVP